MSQRGERTKRVSELERIFNEIYMQNKEDSAEVIKTDESFDAVAKKLNLKHEEYCDVSQKNIDCSIAYEKQGFISGFQYAVKREKKLSIGCELGAMESFLEKSGTVLNLLGEQYFKEEEPNREVFLREYNTIKNLFGIVQDYFFNIWRLKNEINDVEKQSMGEEK